MKKRLPVDPSELVALPPPDANDHSTVRQLADAGAHYLERWRWTLSEYEHISTLECSFTCPKCGQNAKFSGLNLWYRLMLVSGAYYESATRRLILRGLDTRGGPLPAGLNLNSIDELFNKFPSDAPIPDQVRNALFLQMQYRLALVGTYFIGPLRAVPSGNIPIQPFEQSAHGGLLRLQRMRNASRNLDYRRLVSCLTEGLTELLNAVYSLPYPAWNAEHKIGPFSAIRLPELALLARRDPGVLKRYGAKNVESIYEQQLALLVQSLGFVVVKTRKGDRTVDLVCISVDTNNSMTILVEAKTTTHNYSLPAADQRALVEYSRDVRQNLTTMPPLSLVLIVAPEPSSSMESRLATLEAEAGVPVRLLSAADLAQLRELIVGPLRLGVFRSAVLTSPTRVLRGLQTAISEDSKKIAQAHETLVRACLPGARVEAKPRANWDHEHADTQAQTSTQDATDRPT